MCFVLEQQPESEIERLSVGIPVPYSRPTSSKGLLKKSLPFPRIIPAKI
jgi:hypothetical protein